MGARSFDVKGETNSYLQLRSLHPEIYSLSVISRLLEIWLSQKA